MSKPVSVGSLKVGYNIIIDGEPCRIVSVEKSKPGKHGSARARVVAMGIFDDQKRSLTSPVDSRVEVPIVEKRSGQVISVADSLNLMDNETYEIVEIPLPPEGDLRAKLEPGATVGYWKVLDRFMIVQVKP